MSILLLYLPSNKFLMIVVITKTLQIIIFSFWIMNKSVYNNVYHTWAVRCRWFGVEFQGQSYFTAMKCKHTLSIRLLFKCKEDLFRIKYPEIILNWTYYSIRSLVYGRKDFYLILFVQNYNALTRMHTKYTPNLYIQGFFFSWKW